MRRTQRVNDGCLPVELNIGPCVIGEQLLIYVLVLRCSVLDEVAHGWRFLGLSDKRPASGRHGYRVRRSRVSRARDRRPTRVSPWLRPCASRKSRLRKD